MKHSVQSIVSQTRLIAFVDHYLLPDLQMNFNNVCGKMAAIYILILVVVYINSSLYIAAQLYPESYNNIKQII